MLTVERIFARSIATRNSVSSSAIARYSNLLFPHSSRHSQAITRQQSSMATDQRIPVQPAKILEQRTYIAPDRMAITEHHFLVPKDYSNPSGGTLRLFARSARRHTVPVGAAKPDQEAPPWMVYLQGGPGGACPLPQTYSFTSLVLDKGYQFLFLDQRGTGLSTPVTASTLAQQGDVNLQADQLTLYRADNIVRDCEAVRLALTAGEADEEKRKWSTLGQSFGGFVTISYLSFYPESLRESFIFSGLQPLLTSPDEVYQRLTPVLRRRNQAYYGKYPEDVDRVKKILQFLRRDGDGSITLPDGSRLTTRMFMQMGIAFGAHGKIDEIHDIVLRSTLDIEQFDHLTTTSLGAIAAAVPFNSALIYSLLHEPIYCVGEPANWSAHRVIKDLPEWSLDRMDSPNPVYFTGEMIFPWMFDDDCELRKVKDVAEALAAKDDWPALFDRDQLARNTVPVYASAFTEDLYVDCDLSMATAAAIKGCKVYVTNMLYHDALRDKSKEIVDHLFKLRDDVID